MNKPRRRYEGESLAHKIAGGVFAPREAAEMVKKVTEAIAYAHVEGVVLASASWDQTVKVWNATSGQETLTLRGHRLIPVVTR